MMAVRSCLGTWRALGGLLASALAGPAATAMATGGAAACVVPPALPDGAGYVPLGQLHIQGQPVCAWVFDAPGSVPEIMSWLTAREPALRDVWVAPGSAVLTGFAGGLHWAARLFDAGNGRTHGTISALPLDGRENVPGGERRGGADARDGKVAGAGPVPRGVFTPDATWRLKGGQLRFEVRSRDDDTVVVEQIWTHAAGPAELASAVAAELAAEGWQSSGNAAPRPMPGGLWSRSRMQLSVLIVPLDGGSGVTTVLRIGE